VNGTLGEKVKIGANFDSNNSFLIFKNQAKSRINNGVEEDIVKNPLEIAKCEHAGSKPIDPRCQNLFWRKTQLQFGKAKHDWLSPLLNEAGGTI